MAFIDNFIEICNECLDVVLPQCIETLYIESDFPVDSFFKVYIEDSDNNVYQQIVLSDSIGTLEIDMKPESNFGVLPDGLCNKYANKLKMYIFLLDDEYSYSYVGQSLHNFTLLSGIQNCLFIKFNNLEDKTFIIR